MELNGQTVLFVEGVLHNSGKLASKAPGLKLALVGDDGRALYAWTAKAARPDLAPGADVAFQTRLASPPETFKSITVAFDAR
jgi:membrane protein required for beta-lactamase induction